VVVPEVRKVDGGDVLPVCEGLGMDFEMLGEGAVGEVVLKLMCK